MRENKVEVPYPLLSIIRSNAHEPIYAARTAKGIRVMYTQKFPHVKRSIILSPEHRDYLSVAFLVDRTLEGKE